MPKGERVICVFISAPDEVRTQIKAVAKIVDQLNDAHGKHLGIRLRLIYWRRDVVPGLGPDSQEVINTQIGEDYEIFLGLLWTRFGTPTPRAGSGTEEEFNRAYARWQTNPESLAVMMYFSEVSISPSAIDVHQLAKVRDFRSGIQDQGIYSVFKTRSEFKSLVDTHLSHHMHKWSSKPVKTAERGRAPRKSAPEKIILQHEKVPFRQGQSADFFEKPISSNCKGFKIKINNPPEPYWRAGFALAPKGYLSVGRCDVTITRHFLFHVGRGSSAAPTVPTELHYQAYYEDRPITYTTPFRASDPIEVDVRFARNRHRIKISMGDVLYQTDLDLTGFRSLYILAWADQFGPFRIPVELTLF